MKNNKNRPKGTNSTPRADTPRAGVRGRLAPGSIRAQNFVVLRYVRTILERSETDAVAIAVRADENAIAVGADVKEIRTRIKKRTRRTTKVLPLARRTAVRPRERKRTLNES